MDQQLPNGGWPTQTTIECLHPGAGSGEIRLFLPAMHHAIEKGLIIAWIAPPHRLNAAALLYLNLPLQNQLILKPHTQAEYLWATEQCLRSSACAMVLSWPKQSFTYTMGRRLQLAARSTQVLGILFRPLSAAQHNAPAPLRLSVTPQGDRLDIQLFKLRGSWYPTPITLTPRHQIDYLQTGLSKFSQLEDSLMMKNKKSERLEHNLEMIMPEYNATNRQTIKISAHKNQKSQWV